MHIVGAQIEEEIVRIFLRLVAFVRDDILDRLWIANGLTADPW